MKKLLLNSLAITALFGLMSNACDNLKEVLDVPLNIEEKFAIEIQTTDYAYHKEFTTPKNATISKYLGNIESVSIEEIGYKIIEKEGHESSVSLDLGLRATEEKLVLLPNTKVLYGVGEYHRLDLSEEIVNKIADSYKENGKLLVNIDADHQGGYCNVYVVLYFKGTLNSL